MTVFFVFLAVLTVAAIVMCAWGVAEAIIGYRQEREEEL